MDKLFKQIKENIFKLTEWDDEEMYSPEYYEEPDFFPKENKLKTISKLEEQEGFNFIIRYVVPLAVKDWNNRNENRSQFQINPRDVVKHTKKYNVYRAPTWNPGLKFTDRITYISNMTWLNPPPTTDNRICSFQFSLFKDVERRFKLMADWSHNFSRSRTNYVVGMDIFYKPKEEPDDNVDQEELNEEEKKDLLKISKQEEELAFHFIKKVVVPVDVRNNNKEIDEVNKKQGKNYQFSHVKVEDVLRNLKKTADYYSRQHGQQLIEYEAQIQDPHPKIGNRRINRFWYTIFKSVWNKKLMVQVGQYTQLEVGKSIPGDKIQYIESQILNENIRFKPEEYHISKMEEQAALRVIIKQCIPELVKAYNTDVCKRRKKYQPVTEKEVIMNLKKSEPRQYKTAEFIDYQSPIPGVKGKAFLFMISKTDVDLSGAGKRSFDRPKLQAWWSYPLGIAQFPKNVLVESMDRSWYWYDIDELQHGFLTGLNEEQRICRVSKVQEQEGLQFIKRYLIKRAVNTFNKNVIGYEVTEKEVASKLKKIVDYRPTEPSEGGWLCDMIAYGSKIDRIKNHIYPDGLKFRFDIAVDGEGALIVAYTTPLSNNRSWLKVAPPLNPTPILEAVAEEAVISKIEEDYILNRIYSYVIPKLIDEKYNKFLDRYPIADPKKYPRIGYQSVRKNLRKIGREPKEIIYQSKIPGSLLEFNFIVKKYKDAPYIGTFVVYTHSIFGMTQMSGQYAIK